VRDARNNVRFPATSVAYTHVRGIALVIAQADRSC